MKKPLLWALLLGLVLGGLTQQIARWVQEPGDSLTPEQELLSGRPQVVPMPGSVTLLDLGADACAPCRAMTPILAELSEEYQGRVAVMFIDVWEHPEQAEIFGVRDVPTQLIFDVSGNEVFRHQGFLDKAAIEVQLAPLLAEQDSSPSNRPAESAAH